MSPTIERAKKAARSLNPGDKLLVSENTLLALKAEAWIESGVDSDLFQIGEFQVVSSRFVPHGEMWACAPVKASV